MVFVILDNPANKDSVLDIRVPIFRPGKLPEIKSYMEQFPFPFYIILRDINALPVTLSDALRQWFELVSSFDWQQGALSTLRNRHRGRKKGSSKCAGETTVGLERWTEGLSHEYETKAVILGKVAFLRNKPWQQPLTRFAIWDVRGPNEQSFVNDGKFVRFLKIEVNEMLKLSLPKFDLRTKNNLSQIVFADYTADKLLRTKLQGYWNISFILSSEKETHCSLGICLSSGKRLTLKCCTVIEHLLPSLPPPPLLKYFPLF